MLETVAGSVHQLVGRMDAIERETESIYLGLGKVFRAVMSAVDASAAATEASVQAVMSERLGGVSRELAESRGRQYIEQATRYFDRASDSERRFMAGVDDGMAHLAKLEGIIARIRSDSEEMEIISLNAMTVALKSGTAGRAFSVITDELKRLSGRTIRHADDLSSAGNSLMERLAALRKTTATLAETQSAFFESAKRTLETGFESLNSEVELTARSIRELGVEASSVRRPIADIMQEVQLQDIIRQSLDHVRISLRAVEEGGEVDPIEEKVFALEIARLSASLLDEISGQVKASLDRFKKGMGGVDQVTETVEAKRSALAGADAEGNGGEGFRNGGRLYLSSKRDAVAEAARMYEGVKELDERFKEMDQILARFKSIVTASRIETAKNRALSVVSTTVLGMMELTEGLASDVEAAGEVTRAFGKSLSAGTSHYLAGAAGDLADLEREMEKLRAEFDALEGSRKRLREAGAGFNPFSDEFQEALRGAKDAVQRIEYLIDDLLSMRDALSSWAEESELASGGGASQTIHSDRLKSIVERFTIFAHKKTASQVARLHEEDDSASAESGDVTLF